MKVEVVDLGPCRKRLTVEVEVEKVKQEYDSVCKELGQNVQLPGFRKGRVPRNLLVGKFGRQISADAKGKLVDSSFKDVVKDKELEPVGGPELDLEKIEFDSGKPLQYECEIEVKPEFEPPDCVGLKLERPSREVTEEEFEEALKRVSRRFAEVHPVEGPARDEDFLLVDVKLSVEGKEAWKDSERPVGLVGERALGLPFEFAAPELIGASAGQTRSAEVELPVNFQIQEYAGKKAQAEIKVKDVKRPRLPELDDELAKKMGGTSAEDVRKKLREGLAEEKKAAAEEDLRRQIVDRLIAATSFELPEKLLERAATRDEVRRGYQLEKMGVPGETLSAEAREEIRNVSRQQAEHDLRASLILERIAKARELGVSDEEIDGRFAALAARRGLDPATLKRHAEERGEMEMVRAELQGEKVLNFILGKADIKQAEAPAKEAAKKPREKAEKTPAEKTPAKKGPAKKTPAKKGRKNAKDTGRTKRK